MRLWSWGRLYPSDCQVKLVDRYALKRIFKNNKKLLVQGSARSYGDVCLNTNQVIVKTSILNFFRSFDPASGILTCEAGILLKDIQDVFISKGWMLPVTPGTQLITVGGAIANDVHGKNHHIRGNFGHHVLEIELLRSSGELLICTRQTNKEIFYATIGGIGLTGIIVSAKIRLMPVVSPYLNVEYKSFKGVTEFLNLNKESADDWEYTVSWIDCLSGKNFRGVFIRANHLETSKPCIANKSDPKKIPFLPPISLINKASLKLFNQFYYFVNAKKQGGSYLQHFYDFQYPLDNIENWNVLYGRKGFYQYQCVIPLGAAACAIEEILELLQVAQQGSFLVVLKVFGNVRSEGLLSFPIEGITLALDFPNLGTKTLELFDLLDKVVLKAGGRLYLAKDARMSKELFEKMYPEATEFKKLRDPALSSDMALRLFGE
ncbi:FAD-binding oxidoreductase [Acinetobacter venetianus]|uniref:FAD-binding oxidoreductase n=1 Tax=Acinetobacter venetianus TaxID=52133 RepID=UPI0007786237|nr:putative decaprenylphosphoryl-beta-D-ribose oxidase [Acinetobacter venetianus]